MTPTTIHRWERVSRSRYIHRYGLRHHTQATGWVLVLYECRWWLEAAGRMPLRLYAVDRHAAQELAQGIIERSMA